MFKRHLVVSGLILCLHTSGAGKSFDFLILENPASLEILNRYEQALTSAEKRKILPLAPLKIAAEKAVLGDGITPVMEVDYEGQAYYLIRKGWTENPPAMHRHRGCRLEDGGEKLAGSDIGCTRGAAPGGRSATLQAGDAVQAVFTCGSQSYLKRTGAKVEYLWCPAGGPFVAKDKSPAIGETGLSPDMQSLLRSRLESANATYASYTQAFNRLTGESRKPPLWDCSFSKDGMRCRLEGGMRSEDLEKSTVLLVNELRNSLTGKPFDVTMEKSGIEVTPRAGRNPPRP
ncbi:MAG: hypothetical protein ABIW76_16675 [Fibrobacteria bacterium]